MCGIAGLYSPDYSIHDAVPNMVASLIHRGPDSQGGYREGPFCGGMRRLSINDLEGGDQPLLSEDGAVVMLYNGEIYNSPQLRRELEAQGTHFKTSSDGEVVCHLFQKFGVQAFDRLDGMFAISLWSVKEQALYLVRDLPGEKPLYYTPLGDSGLAYASELRALRKVPNLNLELNKQAIWDFPTFLWIPEPDTIYHDVWALPRGHYLRFQAGEMQIKPIKNQFSTAYKNKAVDKGMVLEVVERAVKSRLLADVPVGCFLSSGLDSSIVTSIAQRELGSVTTFSIGFEDVDDPYHGKADESAAAKEYAEILGTTHHEIRVTASDFKEALPTFCQYGDQPFAVSSGLGILFIAAAAREHGIKTLLSGDGADELFGGYSWYKDLQHPCLSHMREEVSAYSVVSYQNFGMPLEERMAVMAGYSDAQKAWAWHYYAAEEEKANLFNRDLFENTLSSVRYFQNYKAFGAWEPTDFVRQDREFYLPFEMMRKMDRMTMAHSVEGRAPFVASEVLAMCEQLTYEQMVTGGTLKPLLREAFNGVLPERIRQRPKHGFNVPIDHWLKGGWHHLIDGLNDPQAAINRLGILEPVSGKEMIDRMLYDTKRLNGHSVFCFIMLNMWLEQQGF